MRPLSRLAGLTTLALAASLLTSAPAVTAAPAPSATSSPATSSPGEVRAKRPNIVLVQMDDVSLDLMRTMSQVRRMQAEGLELTNSFTVDSLCCPSRAATFTGRAPHHNGVTTNQAGDGADPIGGWPAYVAGENLGITFHAEMKRRGYTTGFSGKFLNQYAVTKGRAPRLVPGWSEFEPVFAGGYKGWDYQVGRKVGKRLEVRTIDKPRASARDAVKDRAYVQSFIERRTLDFLDRHSDDAKPFLYVMSPYAAHSRVGKPAYRGDPRFPAAFRDRPGGTRAQGNCGRVACESLSVTDLPGWNDSREGNEPVRLVSDGDGGVRPVGAGHWRPAEQAMGAGSLTAKLRDRARMLQSVDRTLRKILDRVEEDTYVVLTSDNGYHLGQYQLGGGKGTPYQTDSRVPLYVVGPGVPAGVTRTAQVSNIDLAPTFERIAGIAPRQAPARDGVSFLDQLGRDPEGPGGRFTFVEHTQAPGGSGPDREAALDSVVDSTPSYVGVRSDRGLLARFDLDPRPRPAATRFAWELYTYESGFEDTNVFAERFREEWVQDLMDRVRMWANCEPQDCRELTR